MMATTGMIIAYVLGIFVGVVVAGGNRKPYPKDAPRRTSKE